MRTLFRLIILTSVVILWTSGNLQAAKIQLGKDGQVFKPNEVFRAFSDGLSLAPGKHVLGLNFGGIVWQKGSDAHGWEPDDQIIVQVFLNEVLLTEIVESGLDGQNQRFDMLESIEFEIENKGKLEINVFSDVSDKKERWKVSNAELSGVASTPVPIPSALVLLVSGLVGLIGLKKMKY